MTCLGKVRDQIKFEERDDSLQLTCTVLNVGGHKHRTRRRGAARHDVVPNLLIILYEGTCGEPNLRSRFAIKGNASFY